MNGPPSRNRRTSSSWASAARGIGALGCNASFLVIARSIGYAARCVSAVYPHILMGCPRYGGAVEPVNARERIALTDAKIAWESERSITLNTGRVNGEMWSKLVAALCRE